MSESTDVKRSVGKPRALSEDRRKQVIEDRKSGDYTFTMLAEKYGVGRATIYRIVTGVR